MGMDMLIIIIECKGRMQSFNSLAELKRAAKVLDVKHGKITSIYDIYINTSSAAELLKSEYDTQITFLNTYFKGITVDLFLKFVQKYNLNWLILFEKFCPKDIKNLLVNPNAIIDPEESPISNMTHHLDDLISWAETNSYNIKTHILNLKEMKISFLSLEKRKYAFLLKWGFLCPIKRRKWLIQMIVDDQLY